MSNSENDLFLDCFSTMKYIYIYTCSISYIYIYSNFVFLHWNTLSYFFFVTLSSVSTTSKYIYIYTCQTLTYIQTIFSWILFFFFLLFFLLFFRFFDFSKIRDRTLVCLFIITTLYFRNFNGERFIHLILNNLLLVKNSFIHTDIY